MSFTRTFLLSVSLLVAASTAAFAGRFGALATSPNADFGYSYNYDYADDARDRAMAECGKYSRECEVKRTFEDVCVSVAKASNGAMGWSWGYGRGRDNENALNECRNNDGRDCELSVRFCTGNAGD
jgi:hypothetical protein